MVEVIKWLGFILILPPLAVGVFLMYVCRKPPQPLPFDQGNLFARGEWWWKQRNEPELFIKDGKPYIPKYFENDVGENIKIVERAKNGTD